MRSINIEKSLHDDILDFCKVNGINDVDDFINKTLRKGFDLKKYGIKLDNRFCGYEVSVGKAGVFIKLTNSNHTIYNG